MLFRLLADAVLFLHFGFVAFVVLGLAAILAGGALGWGWVRRRSFRMAHLVAIGIVVVQSWLGLVCPLTTLEMWARQRGGDAAYEGGFIAHWVDRVLFWSAPDWVFVVLYTAFATLVVVSWRLVPPERGGRQPDQSAAGRA